MRMWPERISMSRGGERIEEVIGRKEEMELPEFRSGAFELDGGEERILADEKFLNRFVPEGEVQRHTMRALFGSFRVVSESNFECQEVEYKFLLGFWSFCSSIQYWNRKFHGIWRIGISYTDLRINFCLLCWGLELLFFHFCWSHFQIRVLVFDYPYLN